MSSSITHYCDVIAGIIRKRIPEYYDPDRAMIMAYLDCIKNEDALRAMLEPQGEMNGFVKAKR